MTRTKRDRLVDGFVALGSLVFLLWIIPNFTPPYPGYGVSSALLPSIVVGIILVLSVISLGNSFWAQSKKTSASEKDQQADNICQNDKIHLGHLIGFMIPCLLLMPAMKWAGFIPGGFLFMCLMQYLCGQRKPITMVIVAVCSVGTLYVAMRWGLGVPMP